jgi:replicative DNA helicase
MAFSIEMSDIELGKRFLAANATDDTGFSAWTIRNPRLITRDKDRELVEEIAKVADLPIWVDDRGNLKIDQILASARLFIRRHGVQLIVVDYLQLVQAPGRETRDRVAAVSNALRQLAKSENVAVVQLSQLVRPKNINDRPTMLQLKESGDVEAHSHVIVMPYMPVDEKGELAQNDQVLIVAKNRDGSVGEIPVKFDTKRLQFVERT